MAVLVLLTVTFMTLRCIRKFLKKIMFIPVRAGLRKIREIFLTPMDEKNNEIKDLKDVTVYLQLKEE